LLPGSAAGAVFTAASHAVKVAAATAISYITDWQIAMRARYIVIGMTGSALRLICRKRPCNYLVVGSMAVDTKNACSVIAGVIR
jgi:hypothetical protein